MAVKVKETEMRRGCWLIAEAESTRTLCTLVSSAYEDCLILGILTASRKIANVYGA